MAANRHIGDLSHAVDRLGAFLDVGLLTVSIAQLEASMAGRDGDGVASAGDAASIDFELFRAARQVRGRLGRLNDVALQYDNACD